MRKQLGRIAEVMNYMTYVDISGQCPANKIQIDCQTVEEIIWTGNIQELSHHLAKLSRFYNNHCETYDFITQYFARAFAVVDDKSIQYELI